MARHGEDGRDPNFLSFGSTAMAAQAQGEARAQPPARRNGTWVSLLDVPGSPCLGGTAQSLGSQRQPHRVWRTDAKQLSDAYLSLPGIRLSCSYC